jgi:hypothetical protein
VSSGHRPETRFLPVDFLRDQIGQVLRVAAAIVCLHAAEAKIGDQTNVGKMIFPTLRSFEPAAN